jgi:hypothetical protein
MLQKLFIFVNIWDMLFHVANNFHLEGKGMDDEYEELRKYYIDAITEKLKVCNDTELLDLILKLLPNK